MREDQISAWIDNRVKGFGKKDALRYYHPFWHYRMSVIRVFDCLGPAGWTMLEASGNQERVADLSRLCRFVCLVLNS